MNRFRILAVGDPAPVFTARSTVNPQFKFDTVAGRFIVLCFLGTLADADSRAAIDVIRAHRSMFDDERLAFFGVVADLPPQEAGTLAKEFRFFLDSDGAVGQLFGAVPVDRDDSGRVPYARKWVVLDPMLRVAAMFPFESDGADRGKLANFINALPPLDRYVGFPIQAPVLVLPRVFEPELCRRLIDLYETHGGEESGFMKEIDGKTVAAQDHQHKRRSDYTIDDPEMIRLLQSRIQRRIVPEIFKAHQFKVTRMERYIVGCYDSSTGGHFRPHRDNTTKGTAHRRFAVSINLNSEFEGGTVSFPEFSPAGLKPPPGGCVVFSCSLMHAVSPVTAGKRYAFLPFLYDDEAAKVREANNAHLGEGVGSYRLA
jgi:predicted 2-oxoglutarate/Fe(II)-dependent dioxygenase YbiX/peroxiredoxin